MQLLQLSGPASASDPRTYVTPPALRQHGTSSHGVRTGHRCPCASGAAPPPRLWIGRFGVRHLGPGGFAEIHTVSRIVRRHGPMARLDGYGIDLPTRKALWFSCPTE